MATNLFYRHTRVVRLTHWVNALAIVILMGSGLNILSAHPALYWGAYGADADRPLAAIEAVTPDGGDPRGVLKLGGATFDTTGAVGVIGGEEQTFPGWATIPSNRNLSMARRWHFFFAWMLVLNGLVYWIWSLARRHAVELAPSREDLRPRNLWGDFVRHLKLDFPKGEEAKHYHPLQKIAYFSTVALLIPMMVVTGLCMSPGMDTVAPWIVDLFGGRQSARTLHFIFFALILGFFIIHILQVILAGPWNEVRSMVTGRFDLGRPKEKRA